MKEVFEYTTEQIAARNAHVITQFRSDGRVADDMPEGVRLLLLTMVGAKTGAQRVVPLGYFDIDGVITVCAAFGGAPRHPDWVFNLRANPHVGVELTDGKFDATAHEVPPSRRDDVWTAILAATNGTGDPRTKTTRTIPLFELTPVG